MGEASIALDRYNGKCIQDFDLFERPYALDGGAPPATAVLVGALVCLTRQKVKAKFLAKCAISRPCRRPNIKCRKIQRTNLMHSVSQSKRKFIALFSNGNQKATKDANILCQDSNSKNDGVAQKKIRRDIRVFAATQPHRAHNIIKFRNISLGDEQIFFLQLCTLASTELDNCLSDYLTLVYSLEGCLNILQYEIVRYIWF